MQPSNDDNLRLLINGGDNMLGRGVQLSCWHQAPGEENITDSMPSRYYLGSALHPSSSETDADLTTIRSMNRKGLYLWGDYLDLKIQPPPVLRIFNLETAVTESINNNDVPTYKGINYHLHVRNFQEVFDAYAKAAHGGAAGIPFVVSYANNHCLDFGRKALEEETLPALQSLVHLVGAGRDAEEAQRPVEVEAGGVTVQVFAMATLCSGTPEDWEAKEGRSGVFWLPAITTCAHVKQAMTRIKAAFKRHGGLERRTGRIRVASIHWGPNWAYRRGYSDGQIARRALAHELIDHCGVDLVYGHSSHHVRGLELHNGKLIIYGAGDLINDYEGFQNPGDDAYSRLGTQFIIDLSKRNARLTQLILVPTFMNRLRLCRLRESSAIWSPPEKRMKRAPNEAQVFRDFVNAMSRMDSEGEDAVQLRLLAEHVDVPGGPALVFP